MLKCLSNIKLVVGVAALVVVLSLFASFTTSSWHWFGRSGAILTIAGVILSARPLIRLGFTEWLRSLQIIDGGHIIPTQEEIEEEVQSKKDASAFHVGVYMTLIGTLIWAYGDLIGGIPNCSL